MRKIKKGGEPVSLSTFRKANPTKRYGDLSHTVRDDVRQQCAAEQYYLCAYCCQSITGTNADTMNEHVIAQSVNNNRTLDFTNIVASCRTLRQCDASHENQEFELTPFMDECETELRFMYSGRVQGISERAKTTIRVLNLGDVETSNKALIERRKQLVSSLVWKYYGSPQEQLVLEDDTDLMRLLIEDLNNPEDGRLTPFSPVLINILREQLSRLE